MTNVIRSPERSPEDVIQYWGRFFSEIPVCTIPGCERVAREVDAFFPYIDDYNRCDHHPRDHESGTIH